MSAAKHAVVNHGESEFSNLSLSYQLGHRRDGLFDFGSLGRPVEAIEVYMINAQPQKR